MRRVQLIVVSIPLSLALLVTALFLWHNRSHASGPQTAVTTGGSGESPGNLLGGQLHGDRRSGCLWLTPAPGIGSFTPFQVHLYGSYEIEWQSDGFRLWRNHEAIGREGDVLAFGGGPAFPAPAIDGCPVAGTPLAQGLF